MTLVREQIYLTEQEHQALRVIAGLTGRTHSEIIRQALDHHIFQYGKANRLSLLRSARGLWKNRKDLPDFKTLRREWDPTNPRQAR